MKRVFPYVILILLFSSIVPAFGQTNCPVYTFVKIADTTTPVPGGNGGTFEGLSLSMPAINDLKVAFRGEGGGEEGIFVGDGQTLSPIAVVGDRLPGGSFSDPDISGQNVTFRGGASALMGVYARIDGTLVKVADRNDTQPGSVKPFSTFTVPVISGDQVAFRGVGDFAGIYVGDGGPLTVIAQTFDPAPGGSTFISFAQNISTDGEAVAFSGAGSGFIGLFVSDQFGLCRVIDTNDTLEGEDVTQLFMGRDSYSEGMLSFQAVFFDGRRGIYLAIESPPHRAEIIGTWGSGIWYWDATASTFTQMTTLSGAIDIAAGDFNADGIADVASSWGSGLWYQDGSTLAWTLAFSIPPTRVTAGDVTGQ